jgi:hypothetical protein
MKTWKELFPAGRHIFYEGAKPAAFAKEIKARFGFDPSKQPSWSNGYGFHCPAECLDEIYGSNKYLMGS